MELQSEAGRAVRPIELQFSFRITEGSLSALPVRSAIVHALPSFCGRVSWVLILVFPVWPELCHALQNGWRQSPPCHLG